MYVLKSGILLLNLDIGIERKDMMENDKLMEQDTFFLLAKDVGNLQTDIALLNRAEAKLNKNYPGWKYIDKIELRKSWLLIIRYPVLRWNPSKREP